MFYEALRTVAIGILILILLVSITAVGVNLVSTWRDREQAGTALHVTSQVENDPVIINAYVSTDRASSDEEVQCWFQVQNHGEDEMQNVSFEVQAPGFWDKNASAPFDSKREESIAPNTSKMFSSREFKPPRGEPVKFNVTAQFSWTTRDGERRRLVTLGPIIYRDPTESRLRVVSDAYVGYLKDLAIPLVIVALTVVGGRILKESELQRTARGLILERVRDVAEAHYLFIAATARRTATLMTKVRGKLAANITDGEVDLLAFHILQLFRHIRDLVQARGGYILPDKDGEDIVARGQDIYFRLINQHVAPMEARMRAVAHVGSRMDFPEFKDDALPRSSVRDFRSGVDDWVRRRRNDMAVTAALLRVYAETLSYELNVAYFPFRDDWAQLESNDADIKDLEQGSTDARELAAKFRMYSQKQPRRRKRARR